MKQIKAAIIDLYNNDPNEGIRCIKEILTQINNEYKNVDISFELFETRYKGNTPDLKYDIYISSGGPGDPFDGIGKKWETDYFHLVDNVWNLNQNNNGKKKHIFFICHSFQIMARIFKFAEINEKPVKSFGVHTFIKTKEANSDLLFSGLPNPFYAADFRKYEVIQRNEKILSELNASVLATEKLDTKPEPALMAVRISNEIIGTQFHPEADPKSMLYHLKQEERKKFVEENYGKDKYEEMLNNLEAPDKIKLTRKTILPTFLRNAVNNLTNSNS